jgi:molybdate transport system substrate-binding protein
MTVDYLTDKHFINFILILTLGTLSCRLASPASNAPMPVPATETPTRTLTVFAATSLTDAFTEIGAAFDTVHPGVTTTFSFAGSQALRTQIEEGAPADVFASASEKEIDTLVKESFVTKDVPKIFLTNKLVVILPANNPAALEKLEDLANPGIKLLLAAEEVPVGKYVHQALDLMDASFGKGFKDKVLANVVSNEDNVKQVVAKVQLGEADAGIVTELNVIAKYPIAPLVKSDNDDLAAKFMEYVISSEGQTILAKWGFAPVK